jgi:glutathione reductase (NADPH)
VTLVYRGDNILRGFDDDVRTHLRAEMERRGIRVICKRIVEAIEKVDHGLCVELSDHDDIVVDQVMFATGRRPNVSGLGLEIAGVKLDAKGAIAVDEYSRTSVPHIYAVGDVTDRIALTPVAIREGHAFADTVFGGNPRTVDYGCVPSAVFSHPPLAAVGLTEAQARNTLGTIKVYTSDFRAMKNVLAGRNERALYKMIVDATTDRVVGLHMIGPDAPEILQAAAVAVKAGLTKQAFDDTMALHPSMAEELVLMK